MRRNKKFFELLGVLLFVILFNNTFAQQNLQIQPSIAICMAKLKNYTRDINISLQKIDVKNMSINEKRKVRIGSYATARKELANRVRNMNENEFTELVRTIHDGIKNNPINFKKQIYNDAFEVEKLHKNRKKNNISIAMFLNMFRHRIKKNFSENFAFFLTTPLFLRLEVSKINHDLYKSTMDNITKPRTQLLGIVNDIIKGEKIYNLTDEINFYYLNFWRKSKMEFIEGGEYFVALDYKFDNDGNFTLALIPNSETKGLFLIKDNKLIDENNFFNLGKNVEWDIFKKKFKQQFINF